MFFDFPDGSEPQVATGLHCGALLWTLAGATAALGVYWGPLIGLVDRSLQFFIG